MARKAQTALELIRLDKCIYKEKAGKKTPGLRNGVHAWCPSLYRETAEEGQTECLGQESFEATEKRDRGHARHRDDQSGKSEAHLQQQWGPPLN